MIVSRLPRVAPRLRDDECDWANIVQELTVRPSGTLDNVLNLLKIVKWHSSCSVGREV